MANLSGAAGADCRLWAHPILMQQKRSTGLAWTALRISGGRNCSKCGPGNTTRWSSAGGFRRAQSLPPARRGVRHQRQQKWGAVTAVQALRNALARVASGAERHLRAFTSVTARQAGYSDVLGVTQRRPQRLLSASISRAQTLAGIDGGCGRDQYRGQVMHSPHPPGCG
jgi:hypothetical protein